MKEFLLIIKSLASVPLILLDLAAFPVGIFCLYGGPDGNANCAEALIGATAGIGGAAIMVLLSLAIWRFDKRYVLTLLILHEIILLLFFALMVVAITVRRDLPQLMAHPTPIVLAALIAGGYGICKTVKAIKAESKDV